MSVPFDIFSMTDEQKAVLHQTIDDRIGEHTRELEQKIDTLSRRNLVLTAVIGLRFAEELPSFLTTLGL